METKLATYLLLCLAGMVVHFVKKLYDLEQAGTILNPLDYVKQRPYAVTLAVMGGLMLLLVWYYMNQLNELTAIFTGIACSEAFDTLRARAAGKLQTIVDKESGV